MPMGPMCTEGMKIALEAIEGKNEILKDYSIEFQMTDERCTHPIGVQGTIETMRDAVNGTNDMLPLIVGPLCAENGRTGLFVKHFDFVNVVDTSIAAEVYTDRDRYHSFHTFQASSKTLYVAIPYFIKQNGWKRVFLLTEMRTYWKNVS